MSVWRFVCGACYSSIIMPVPHDTFMEFLNSSYDFPCEFCKEDLKDWAVSGEPFEQVETKSPKRTRKKFTKKRTNPFLTAADIVMLREMKIGIGIKLEAS